MEDKASLNSRIVALGVSRSYASEIVNGKRNPSLHLAVKIYRKLGVKLGPIANATPAEISAIERVGAKRLGAVP
jgi:transcriptional regulator with XRE-family HTH domain